MTMPTPESETMTAAQILCGAGMHMPLPASIDPDLIAQFDARVRRLFALVDLALSAGASTLSTEALRDALHKVAGTALFFGHAALGRVAADYDERMRECSVATPAFLDAMRHALHLARIA